MEVIESGHRGNVQVRRNKTGRGRSWHAAWYPPSEGKKKTRLLGPAHVKDSGRRTKRNAVVWRAGDGPKPTPAHLVPDEAIEELRQILRGLSSASVADGTATLRDALDGHIEDRLAQGLIDKRTAAIYDRAAERFCRDLDGDRALVAFDSAELKDYVLKFRAQKFIGRARAREEQRVGSRVEKVEIQGLVAQAPEDVPIEVPTKDDAIATAARIDGTWTWVREGTYRVVRRGRRQQARRVRPSEARRLAADGFVVSERRTTRWVIYSPASAETKNKYRDLLAAAFAYAVAEGWLVESPMDDVPRVSMKRERQGILRREDFYTPDEVSRLMGHAPGPREKAFWLLGSDAGFRLPGEAQALSRGAVDFSADVVRPHDAWKGDEVGGTKTGEYEPIPMTPRLRAALWEVMQRDHWTADSDFVFARPENGRPVSARRMREAFKAAQKAAGLKKIPMYHMRHTFGTACAARGMPARVIQQLMRHTRLSTTEKYMAYAPQEDLGRQLAEALQPDYVATLERVATDPPTSTRDARRDDGQSDDNAFRAQLFAELDAEIPAKWLRVVQDVWDKTESKEGVNALAA